MNTVNRLFTAHTRLAALLGFFLLCAFSLYVVLPRLSHNSMSTMSTFMYNSIFGIDPADYVVSGLYVVGPDEPLDSPAARLVRARGWGSPATAARARRLMAALDGGLAQAGVDYVVADGSLLGLCRGQDGGWVDWDDDIDIMIPRADFERDLSGLRTDLRRRGLVLREVVPNDMYKVYFTGAPRAGDRDWGFPFVDIFVFDVDPTTRRTSSIAATNGAPGPSLSIDYLFPPRRVVLESTSTSTRSHRRNATAADVTVDTADADADVNVDVNDFNNVAAGPLEISIPNRAGRYLDAQFAGWRRWCVVNGWSHAREAWESAEGLWGVQGRCEDIMRLRGGRMAPPFVVNGRCPSPSSEQELIPLSTPTNKWSWW